MMDIRSELLKENSVAQGRKICNYIMQNRHKFDELMDYFLGPQYRLAQYSARPVNMCVEQDINLVYPYLEQIIHHLANPPHNAVRRNSLRMLEIIDIPEEYIGELAEHCFEILNSAKEPVANRVFAMSVLLNIVKKYPDLNSELKLTIEDHMEHGSAGFKSRGKKVLKALGKLNG